MKIQITDTGHVEVRINDGENKPYSLTHALGLIEAASHLLKQHLAAAPLASHEPAEIDEPNPGVAGVIEDEFDAAKAVRSAK